METQTPTPFHVECRACGGVVYEQTRAQVLALIDGPHVECVAASRLFEIEVPRAFFGSDGIEYGKPLHSLGSDATRVWSAQAAREGWRAYGRPWTESAGPERVAIIGWVVPAGHPDRRRTGP